MFTEVSEKWVRIKGVLKTLCFGWYSERVTLMLSEHPLPAL